MSRIHNLVASKAEGYQKLAQKIYYLMPRMSSHQVQPSEGGGFLIADVYSCHLVGNRQMLSIGGIDATESQGNDSVDPAAQGLQIFDLTEMRWSHQYDAGAAPYQSPQVIKDWYLEQ